MLNLIARRDIIFQFARREFSIKYRGSVLGILWSVVRPLMMLAIYAVVFGFIFKSRYFSQAESPLQFALAMFAGLSVYDFFSECVGRAPSLIKQSSNLVTKVVFPIETLPIAIVAAGAVQLAVDLVLLVSAYLIVEHTLHASMLFLPLIALPLVLITLGLTWLLASLGVFVRDIASFVRPMLTIIAYCSAIFYPIERVPPPFRRLVEANPLALIADQSRKVVVLGAPLQWTPWLYCVVVGIAVASFGYWFFMRTKHAFADVL